MIEKEEYSELSKEDSVEVESKEKEEVAIADSNTPFIRSIKEMKKDSASILEDVVSKQLEFADFIIAAENTVDPALPELRSIVFSFRSFSKFVNKYKIQNFDSIQKKLLEYMKNRKNFFWFAYIFHKTSDCYNSIFTRAYIQCLQKFLDAELVSDPDDIAQGNAYKTPEKNKYSESSYSSKLTRTPSFVADKNKINSSLDIKVTEKISDFFKATAFFYKSVESLIKDTILSTFRQKLNLSAEQLLDDSSLFEEIKSQSRSSLNNIMNDFRRIYTPPGMLTGVVQFWYIKANVYFFSSFIDNLASKLWPDEFNYLQKDFKKKGKQKKITQSEEKKETENKIEFLCGFVRNYESNQYFRSRVKDSLSLSHEGDSLAQSKIKKLLHENEEKMALSKPFLDALRSIAGVNISNYLWKTDVETIDQAPEKLQNILKGKKFIQWLNGFCRKVTNNDLAAGLSEGVEALSLSSENKDAKLEYIEAKFAYTKYMWDEKETAKAKKAKKVESGCEKNNLFSLFKLIKNNFGDKYLPLAPEFFFWQVSDDSVILKGPKFLVPEPSMDVVDIHVYMADDKKAQFNVLHKNLLNASQDLWRNVQSFAVATGRGFKKNRSSLPNCKVSGFPYYKNFFLPVLTNCSHFDGGFHTFGHCVDAADSKQAESQWLVNGILETPTSPFGLKVRNHLVGVLRAKPEEDVCGYYMQLPYYAPKPLIASDKKKKFEGHLQEPEGVDFHTNKQGEVMSLRVPHAANVQSLQQEFYQTKSSEVKLYDLFKKKFAIETDLLPYASVADEKMINSRDLNLSRGSDTCYAPATFETIRVAEKAKRFLELVFCGFWNKARVMLYMIYLQNSKDSALRSGDLETALCESIKLLFPSVIGLVGESQSLEATVISPAESSPSIPRVLLPDFNQEEANGSCSTPSI